MVGYCQSTATSWDCEARCSGSPCKLRYIRIRPLPFYLYYVMGIKCIVIVGRLFCKTVRPMLSHHCLSVLSVCDIGVLWPNGWTDQDATWRADRSQPWPHCIRWEPGPTPRKGHSPQFSAHICRGQMARWIKMPLGRKIGLDPSDIVLDGDPAPPFQKSGRAHPNFRPCLLCPNGWMDQYATWHRASTQATLC